MVVVWAHKLGGFANIAAKTADLPCLGRSSHRHSPKSGSKVVGNVELVHSFLVFEVLAALHTHQGAK